MNISKLVFASIVLSTITLSGCNNLSHQDKTTAGGAVVGGVAGNLLCSGDLLCTGVGAAAGGVIGHEAGKKK